MRTVAGLVVVVVQLLSGWLRSSPVAPIVRIRIHGLLLDCLWLLLGWLRSSPVAQIQVS